MAHSIFSQPYIRAGIHHIIATLLFTLYGMRVSSFLGAIPFLTLFFQSAIVFLVLYLFRFSFYLGGSRLNALASISLFTLTAIFFAVWHHTFYHFPLESNLKVAFGMILIGSFITIDLSILDTRILLEKPRSFVDMPTSYIPIATQVGFAAVYIIFTLTMLLSLIMSRDLLWISQHDSLMLDVNNINELVNTFLLTTLLIAGYIIVICRNAASLIQRQLAYQVQAMDKASNHYFDNKVPMNTLGEFGIIAYYTNTMLHDLSLRPPERSPMKQEAEPTQDIAATSSEPSETEQETAAQLPLPPLEYDEGDEFAIINNLAAQITSKDGSGRAHLLRIQRYAKALGEELAKNPLYAHLINEEKIHALYHCAPLYDIGKIVIPDNILKKTSTLTEAEMAVIKSHPQIGADLLTVSDKAEQHGFFAQAREIALTHHECWDGSGYPLGLSGEDIPIMGRIIALADTYDALISKRSYRAAVSHEEAVKRILDAKGRQFDPAIVDAFIKTEIQFVDISQRFRDELLYTLIH